MKTKKQLLLIPYIKILKEKQCKKTLIGTQKTERMCFRMV